MTPDARPNRSPGSRGSLHERDVGPLDTFAAAVAFYRRRPELVRPVLRLDVTPNSERCPPGTRSHERTNDGPGRRPAERTDGSSGRRPIGCSRDEFRLSSPNRGRVVRHRSGWRRLAATARPSPGVRDQTYSKTETSVVLPICGHVRWGSDSRGGTPEIGVRTATVPVRGDERHRPESSRE